MIVVGNINGFLIKRVLKDNGFETNNFSGYFRDTKNIFKLAKDTDDIKTRKKYYQMGLLDIIISLGFLCSGFYYFYILISQDN